MLQPSCSRCLRLGIQCVGSGQKRFRFVGDTTLIRRDKDPEVEVAVVSLSPEIEHICNEVSSLQTAVGHALQSENVSYDLSLWGKFLVQVPSRLGHNAALDASAKALVSCYDGFRVGITSLGAIEEYSEALAVLRKSLSNEQEATSLNIICAVYMMIICQVSSLPNDGSTQTDRSDFNG